MSEAVELKEGERIEATVVDQDTGLRSTIIANEFGGIRFVITYPKAEGMACVVVAYRSPGIIRTIRNVVARWLKR